MIKADTWMLIQLVVDVLLFFIIAIYIMRDRKEDDEVEEPETIPELDISTDAIIEQGPDVPQVETLMEELSALVVRAEKAADRIEKASKASPDNTKIPNRKNLAINLVDNTLEAKIEKQSTPQADKGADSDGNYAYTEAARLIWDGLSDDEIVQLVGLPAHEVKLIRNMAE